MGIVLIGIIRQYEVMHTQRRALFLLIFLLMPLSLFSQLCYPIVGTYKGKSAQGMAIWGDNAYLFNDGGHCRVLNLKSGVVDGEFDLASAGKNNHVNAACFGNDMLVGNSIPLLYVSEYKEPSRCFVESINDTSSVLVQTIQIQDKGKPVFVQSWILDRKNGFLYAIARTSPLKGTKTSSRVKISKYMLPSLSEGENIVLSESDCLEHFFVEFASGTQGGVIKGKYMYLPTGLQESARGRFNAERFVQVIDLKKRVLVKRINLTYITTNEPEDMDFYKGKALLYCGQEGGVYEIKLK